MSIISPFFNEISFVTHHQRHILKLFTPRKHRKTMLEGDYVNSRTIYIQIGTIPHTNKNLRGRKKISMPINIQKNRLASNVVNTKNPFFNAANRLLRPFANCFSAFTIHPISVFHPNTCDSPSWRTCVKKLQDEYIYLTLHICIVCSDV